MADPRTATPRTALLMVTYFVVFFAAMTLGGLLFLAGGITIVLIPGSLPTWLEVAYVGSGIVGSVAIAVLVANGAFRAVMRRRPPGAAEPDPVPPRSPRVLAWVAGIAASVLSTVLATLVLTWLNR